MENALKVLTTFRFDVSSAVASAQLLQGQTQALNNTAQGALQSYKSLGMGIAASFGLGAGSIFGSIQKSVIAAEKFNETQGSLANILGQNADRFTTDITSFNKRLVIAESLMLRLGKAASQVGVDQLDMLDVSKQVLSTLLPAGLQGKDFSNIEKITKGFMMTGPMLGVSSGQLQQLLLQAKTGTAQFRGPFRSLAVRTKAFDVLGKENKDVLKAFNVAPVEQRIEILANALTQFGSDAEYLTKRTKTLTFQFNVLKNNLFGLTSVFRPFGEKLRKLFVELLMQLNQLIEKDGKQLVAVVSSLFDRLIKTPKDLLTTIAQIGTAGSLLNLASTGVQIFALLEILKQIPFTAQYVVPIMANLTGSFKAFFALFTSKAGFMTMMGALLPAMKVILFKFLPIISVIAGGFILLSRALAMAKINELKDLPEELASLGNAFNRLVQALSPLLYVLEPIYSYLVRILAFMLDFGIAVKALAWTLDTLVIPVIDFIMRGIVILEAGLRGFFTMFIGFMEQLANLITGKGFSFQKFIDDYQNGINDVFDRNKDFLFGSLQDMSKAPVATLTQNIDSVTINQDFKEAQDPDRIAFTVQEALLKIAQNPTQAIGRSFAGGLAR